MATTELLTGVPGSLLLAGSALPVCLSSLADAPEARGHIVKQTYGQVFATSITVSGLAATTGNNLAVLVLHQSQSVTGVTDNLGGTWLQGPDQNVGTQDRVGIWYRLGVPAGVTSVTVTAAASTALIADVVEFSGVLNYFGGNTLQTSSTSNPAAATVANALSGSIVLSVGGYFANLANGRIETLPSDYERLGHPGLAIATTFWFGSYKELSAGEAAAGPDYGAVSTMTNFGTATAVFGP